MLDALEPITTTESRKLPDLRCIAAGDEHLDLAVRCFAAAGLSDRQLARRIIDHQLAPTDLHDAAVALARHCAVCGMRAREIALALADVAGALPAWPDDPEYLIWLAREAFKAEWGHD